MNSSSVLTRLVSSTASRPTNPELRPLSLATSLILFAIPAGLVAASFHLLRPAFEAIGIPPFKSFLAAITIPMSLIFSAALVAYHKIESRPLQWRAFSQRMRYPRLQLKAVLLGAGIFILANLAYGMATQVGLILINNGLIHIPSGVPALVDPRLGFDLAATKQLAGGSLQGQWDLVALYLVMFFFNIVGEELWWRGYILPRQELAFGRMTWLLHGLLWTGFHVYKWWDMIGLLPVCLILSFTAQKTRDNWPVLIAHGLTNGMVLVLLVAGAAGWL